MAIKLQFYDFIVPIKTIKDKYKNTNNIGISRDPRDIRLPKNLSNILKITKDNTD